MILQILRWSVKTCTLWGTFMIILFKMIDKEINAILGKNFQQEL